ncbi:MAG: hypothetical protein CMO12_04155 [Thaumarchaeota archaeon]|jgi:hypothetical protein|nr:hypothetical protein [Nitrososphaerota archaeon]|tara:strand:+ start:3211 stop:3774 length:564 start_codon:yes stop_codon:yes gene_type:complete
MSHQAEVDRRIKRATRLLLMQRPRAPGVKGWELRRVLGADYEKLLEVLGVQLETLGLQIKKIDEDEREKSGEVAESDKSRFFIIMKDSPTLTEALSSSWRIDELALLAATLAYLISRGGRAHRRDLSELLKSKFPSWKLAFTMERFVRRGYLLFDKSNEMYKVGWRTKVEIDQKGLLSVLLAKPGTE